MSTSQSCHQFGSASKVGSHDYVDGFCGSGFHNLLHVRVLQHVDGPVNDAIRVWVPLLEWNKLRKAIGAKITLVMAQTAPSVYEEGILLITPHTVNENQVVLFPIMEDLDGSRET